MTENMSTTPVVGANPRIVSQPDENGPIPFKTKDLNQAAFIWCQPGAKVKELVGARGQGQTIFFCFELKMSEQQLNDLQLAYANNECVVEPNQFVSRQNALRDLLHNVLGLQTVRGGKVTGDKINNG